MKKCEKCGFENSDINTMCEHCHERLGEKSCEVASEDFFEKLKKREKNKKIIDYLLMIIYLVIAVPLLVLSANRGFDIYILIIMLLIMLSGLIGFYLSLFHPDIMFIISHIGSISLIGETQPSEWYYTITKIGAYFFLGLGLFIMIMMYVFLN